MYIVYERLFTVCKCDVGKLALASIKPSPGV